MLMKRYARCTIAIFGVILALPIALGFLPKVDSGLKTAAWPKFRGGLSNVGRGVGSGAVGVEKWSFWTDGQVDSSPAIGADCTIYVGSWDKHLYALDGKTGWKKWSFKTDGHVDSSPAIGQDGTIYVGCIDNSVYAIR